MGGQKIILGGGHLPPPFLPWRRHCTTFIYNVQLFVTNTLIYLNINDLMSPWFFSGILLQAFFKIPHFLTYVINLYLKYSDVCRAKIFGKRQSVKYASI